MEKKLLFVINPHSGKGYIKTKLLEVIDIFIKGGYEVTVHITQDTNDGYVTAKEQGEKYDAVVVSGGDGTLNEVIRGVMAIDENKRPKIGYLPAGTVNDFAATMNISKNVKKAAEAVVSGAPFKCDVGSFNQRNFVYIAAFGAFTNVSYETPQQNKNMLGQVAYFLEGIKQLHTLPSFKMKVYSDGETYEEEYIFGMVSNSNSIAGIKTSKTIKAELNDGLFEVLLVKKPKTLADLSLLATQLLNAEFDGDTIRTFRTEKIKFLSDEEVRWTLDGEFGGAVNIAEIEVINEAVELIV